MKNFDVLEESRWLVQNGSTEFFLSSGNPFSEQ
jgi:hypothetical protein